MSTPVQSKPAMDPNQKAAVLMAVSQLDMLVNAFETAPEEVIAAAKAFKESLEKWANT